MTIEVLRIGQRLVRDDRVTTHVALVSRAFGASRIYMYEVNPDIQDTIAKVNENWGSTFEVKIIQSWKALVRQKKEHAKLVHLTMYGEEIGKIAGKIAQEQDILVIVGAEKVPREVYDMADYNVSVGSQPHSEISALAVLLDRIQDGKQFSSTYTGAKKRIIPTRNGKRVTTEQS